VDTLSAAGASNNSTCRQRFQCLDYAPSGVPSSIGYLPDRRRRRHPTDGVHRCIPPGEQRRSISGRDRYRCRACTRGASVIDPKASTTRAGLRRGRAGRIPQPRGCVSRWAAL